MENYPKENGIDDVLNNCKLNNYHRDVVNGEVDLKSRSRDSSKSRESNKSYKISHEDLLLDNELANDREINEGVNNKVNHDVRNKDLVSKSFKEIFETNNTTKDVPNKLGFVNKYDDLAPHLSSPDSDDLFDSCKRVSSDKFSTKKIVSSKNINQSTTIVHSVNNNSDTSGGSGILSSDVSNANNRPSDNKTNISNQPNVIQTNTQQSINNVTNTHQSTDNSNGDSLFLSENNHTKLNNNSVDYSNSLSKKDPNNQCTNGNSSVNNGNNSQSVDAGGNNGGKDVISDPNNGTNNIKTSIFGDTISNGGNITSHKREISRKNANTSGNNSNISDLVEKVNTLNSHMSPKVVFHTPQTTPLKLKLNSLPVQSHPLDEHALDQSPDEMYRNEPLDFPNSPVLNKTIDEICLKRYKRGCGTGLGQNPLSRGEEPQGTKLATELNCINTSPASIRGSRSPGRPTASCSSSFESVTLRTTSPARGSASFDSVTQGKTSPSTHPVKNIQSVSHSATAADFTNNVSAESYLKKYDDINAQVRAYLNKTASESNKSEIDVLNKEKTTKSELDDLNERSHRYLNTACGNTYNGSSIDDLKNLTCANKVTYVSDEEDNSLYDTIVSNDCHGVKLVKNPRKPSSLPITTPGAAQSSDNANSGGKKKKLILTSDLFSGNLLDDDLKSMSDQDLDELLTPSNADDDLENSILEQLYLSDDDDDVESIQELSAKEEREESRKWKICMVNGVEKRIDMKVIEPYKRVLSHGGYLNADCHNAIIVFSACFLPHHSRADYHYVMDNLFFYVLHTLDQLITEDYVLVYLHGATSRHNMPNFSWLKRCYQMIDRKLKKNLKQLYLVHATFWLKTIILMSKPFISGKFSKKIQFILSLTELNEKLPRIEEASIPDKVRQYDKIKLSMTSSQQHQ
uniref:Protein prune homolog 2 n=1 Tax=Cacopsylla melanoneura TaxID=428564 RepID=A0A8D9A010_9HEMI